MSETRSVSVPYGYSARPQQMDLWKAITVDGCKRAVCVWHRRFGKSLMAWNLLIREAVKRPGVYWHAFPTYAQAKKSVWDAMSIEGRKYLDYIPPELVIRTLENEMAVWVQSAGGKVSKIQLVGADNIDSLRGAGPLAVVLDEFAEMDPQAWDVLSPMLAANGGWAVFIFTPKGRNHAYKLFEYAKSEPSWYSSLLSIDDTGAVSREFIDAERRRGMPEELIQQEYYCSFEASLVGSFYGDQLKLALEAGRIGEVSFDPSRPVITAWDLGVSDFTSIWFAQMRGGAVRFIDFEEGFGQQLQHYIKKLQSRVDYAYLEALVPHDAGNRHMTGKTCYEMLRDFGFRARMVQKLSVIDGITAVRGAFPTFWFDEKKCAHGIQMLREYTREYNHASGEYGSEPKHNYASHAADALRYFAVGARQKRDAREPIRPKVAIA